MTEWNKYNGSPCQIDFITQSKTDIAYILGDEQYSMPPCRDRHVVKNVLRAASHYLICNPHPLADMIHLQALTGQPVFVKVDRDSCENKINMIYVTTTPDWNIPGAEYSFSSFEKEIEFKE